MQWSGFHDAFRSVSAFNNELLAAPGNSQSCGPSIDDLLEDQNSENISATIIRLATNWQELDTIYVREQNKVMGTGKRSSLVVPYNFNTDDLQPDDINKACDDRLSEVNRTEYFQKLMALLQKVPKATVASESNDTALMTVQNASRSFKRDSAFVPEIASAFAKQKKLSFPSSEDSHLEGLLTKDDVIFSITVYSPESKITQQKQCFDVLGRQSLEDLESAIYCVHCTLPDFIPGIQPPTQAPTNSGGRNRAISNNGTSAKSRCSCSDAPSSSAAPPTSAASSSNSSSSSRRSSSGNNEALVLPASTSADAVEVMDWLHRTLVGTPFPPAATFRAAQTSSAGASSAATAVPSAFTSAALTSARATISRTAIAATTATNAVSSGAFSDPVDEAAETVIMERLPASTSTGTRKRTVSATEASQQLPSISRPSFAVPCSAAAPSTLAPVLQATSAVAADVAVSSSSSTARSRSEKQTKKIAVNKRTNTVITEADLLPHREAAEAARRARRRKVVTPPSAADAAASAVEEMTEGEPGEERSSAAADTSVALVAGTAVAFPATTSVAGGGSFHNFDFRALKKRVRNGQKRLELKCSKVVRCDSVNWQLGTPYLFAHDGCEHIFYVTNIRQYHEKYDTVSVAAYPQETFRGKYRQRKCTVCEVLTAQYVVYGDRLVECSPCFFCAHCYHMLHYSADGQLLYDDFQVFPYLHDP